MNKKHGKKKKKRSSSVDELLYDKFERKNEKYKTKLKDIEETDKKIEEKFRSVSVTDMPL